MILYRNISGFGEGYLLRRNIGLWDGIFEADSPMKFLTEPIKPENLVDIVSVNDGKDLEVYIISSVNKTLAESLPLKEGKLLETYNNAVAKFPERNSFTIDMSTFEVITEDNFRSYSPPETGEYAAFIFPKLDRKGGGFPHIFTLALSNCSGIYKNVFKIQARSSLWVASCAGNPTKVGREFVYVIMNSALQGMFTLEKPTTDDLKFPTNGQSEVPPAYSTNTLKKILESTNINSLKMTENGVKLLPPPEKPPVTAGGKDFSKNAMKDAILSDMKERKSVNLSDICIYGLRNTIALATDEAQDVIYVNIDMEGIAREMYIFGGMLYVVSFPEISTDWVSVFGSDSQVLEVDDSLMGGKAKDYLL